MEKSKIISEIDARVVKASTKKYSIWTIGITDDTLTRKSQHENDGEDVKYWKQWDTDSQKDGRDIEEHFIKKGMKGGSGGGGTADYVYIF